MRGFAGIHRHDLRRDLVHLALQVVKVSLELRLVQLSGFDLIVGGFQIALQLFIFGLQIALVGFEILDGLLIKPGLGGEAAVIRDESAEELVQLRRVFLGVEGIGVR